MSPSPLRSGRQVTQVTSQPVTGERVQRPGSRGALGATAQGTHRPLPALRKPAGSKCCFRPDFSSPLRESLGVHTHLSPLSGRLPPTLSHMVPDRPLVIPRFPGETRPLPWPHASEASLCRTFSKPLAVLLCSTHP